MARIVGIELNDDWRLVYALTKIKGLGWSRARKILKEINIDESKRLGDLTTKETTKLVAKLEEFALEGDLLRKVRADIKRLKTIGSYKGIRHSKGLPVRGQRTKSNARSNRGKRKTVGSYKKEELSKMQQQQQKGVASAK